MLDSEPLLEKGCVMRRLARCTWSVFMAAAAVLAVSSAAGAVPAQLLDVQSLTNVIAANASPHPKKAAAHAGSQSSPATHHSVTDLKHGSSSPGGQASGSPKGPSSTNYHVTTYHGQKPSSTNYHPSSTNYHPSSTNYHPSSTNYHPPSTNYHPSSTNYHPSSTNYHASSTNYHPSSTNYHASTNHHASSTIYHASKLAPAHSYVTSGVSHGKITNLKFYRSIEAYHDAQSKIRLNAEYARNPAKFHGYWAGGWYHGYWHQYWAANEWAWYQGGYGFWLPVYGTTVFLQETSPGVCSYWNGFAWVSWWNPPFTPYTCPY
jgi:hypothetical protein